MKLYSLLAYALGLGGFAYFILYLWGIELLPVYINDHAAGAVLPALLIDLGLMLLWGVQHSWMARAGFKAWLGQWLSQPAERSTYVLTSGVALMLVAWFWQPLPGLLWQLPAGWAYVVLAISALGWLMAVWATFVIDHFDLFGLKPVFPGQPKTTQFEERSLYKLVRHPLQLGILIGMWATPSMTMTHLALAGAMTVYIWIGLYFEERALVVSLGAAYEDYQRRVPKLIPFTKR